MKHQKTSGSCWGVCATGDKVICATDKGVEFRNSDLGLENKINAPGSFDSAQATSKGGLATKVYFSLKGTHCTYIGTEDDPSGTLIHKVKYEGGAYASHMSATDKRIAVIDYVNKQLRVYTNGGDHQFNIDLIDMKWPRGVHLLPDDSAVLVTDRTGGELRKYPLTAAAKPVWGCEALDAPTGITTDEIGLIYVCGHEQKIIYMINQKGM